MRNYYTGVHTAMYTQQWDNSTKARGDWDNKYQRYWGLKKQVGNTAETNHEQQDKGSRTQCKAPVTKDYQSKRGNTQSVDNRLKHINFTQQGTRERK